MAVARIMLKKEEEFQTAPEHVIFEHTASCRMCGALTPFVILRRCHGCVELKKKMKVDIRAALKILVEILKEKFFG